MAEGAIVIDGGMMEGGGQILRNAATLSCLLRKPVTINNIRAGRSKPGLRPQHLTGLCLLRSLSNGVLQGGDVGSTQITLRPGAVTAGDHIADTKTAGSICLLIQAALPCMLYGDGPVNLLLKGGTNADMAPPIDYFQWVFQPMAAKFGVKFECHTKIRGFFPKGGGEVFLNTTPISRLQPVDLTHRGDVTRIHGYAFVAGMLPIKVARIMAQVARETIQYEYTGVPINIDTDKVEQHKAFGTGCGIIVVAETSTGCVISGSALGKRGVPAEDVGHQAGQMLVTNLQHGGCVDEYLQDQFVILMALASGTSRVRCGPVTLHTQTAIEVARLLSGATFSIKEISKTENVIECVGIGLENNKL